jgi:hypothetical protein
MATKKKAAKPKDTAAENALIAQAITDVDAALDARLKLPTVTLIQIVTNPADLAEAQKAHLQCHELAVFGASRIIAAEDAPHVIDYESYNRFVVRELHNYFETEHCLLIQHDGFILNPNAWDPAFLEFDYVGAPFGDGVVGNGGFSLRSRVFCQETDVLGGLIEDGLLPSFAPEDQILCRGRLRKTLEVAGIKFADTETASRFSWELHDNWPEYNGSFGFHGLHTLERLTALKAQCKLGEFAEIPIPLNKWNS